MNTRTLILILALAIAGGALFYFNFMDGGTPPKPPVPASAPKAPVQAAGQQGQPAPVVAAKDGAGQTTQPEVRRIAVVYNAQAERDPFGPLVMPKVATAKEERKKGPSVIGPYELAEIKLIGVVSQDGRAYGVLMTPDGRSYTVREGQRLGDAGEVFRITPNSLTIRDTYRDRKGSVKLKDTTLRLRTEGG